MNGRREICFVVEVALLKYVGKYGAALSCKYYPVTLFHVEPNTV